MTNLKDQASEVFRIIESDLGTTGLLNLILEVFIKMSDDFKSDSVEDYLEQLKEVIIMCKNTSPRIGIVIHYLCEIWDQIEHCRPDLKSLDDIRKKLTSIIKKIQKENKEDSDKIIANGTELIKDGDSILIHSHSKIVLRILTEARKQGKKFRVVVAEQEEEKTTDIINCLTEQRMNFTVVPEFMLSHVESEITKVFLGALTLNYNYNFVTDAGTNSVTSEFHESHIPIYMFLVTKKFALWENPVSHHTYKTVQKKIEKNPSKILTYDRIKFSHDRIPLGLVDHIITEKGKHNGAETKELYDKLFKERAAWRKKHVPELEIE